MFFNQINIEALLQPYLYLDSALIQGHDDGLACRKKFNNANQGIPAKTVAELNQLARAIREGHFERPANWLSYVDALTIYSNHLDQQTTDKVNPKLALAEKEKCVLNYLEAAFQLSPSYDATRLSTYEPRELSSHAQLLFYLGKARRYAGISAEERLPLFEKALAIAKYLGGLSCERESDPHAYNHRISTFELPISYCYQDLHRYDDAITLLLPQLSALDPFILTQAHTQLASAYEKKFKFNGEGLSDAMTHARAAYEVSLRLEKAPHIQYNARVALMNLLSLSADKTEAVTMAAAVMTEYQQDSNCGAKPMHLEAAKRILEADQVSSTMRL